MTNNPIHAAAALALAAFLVLPALATAQVNKCTTADGRTVYQAAPCKDDQQSQQIEITPAPHVPGRPGATVTMGMTAEEVRHSWGEPDTINTSTTASTDREQWVYRSGRKKPQYLYLTNGRLTSWQN